IAATPAMIEPEVDTASPPHGDPLAAAFESEEEAAERAAARQREEERLAEQARLQAQAEAEVQEGKARESERRHARLNELIAPAADAVADADFASARKRFAVVAREWRDLSTGIDVKPDLMARYQELDAQWTAREHAARD